MDRSHFSSAQGTGCRAFLSAAMLATALFATCGWGADIHWDGAGGNGKWSDPTNWMGGVVPGPNDTALFDMPPGPWTVDVDQDVAVGRVVAGDDHGVTVAIGLGANTLTINQLCTVYAGSEILITGGTLVVGNGASLVINNGGSMTMDSGAITNQGEVNINGGGGTLNATGGRIDGGGTLYLQNWATCTFNPSSGELHFTGHLDNTQGTVSIPSGKTLVVESGSTYRQTSGDGQVSGGGTFKVSSGATFRGVGAIAGTLWNQGTVRPEYGEALAPTYYRQDAGGLLDLYIKGTSSGDYGWLYVDGTTAPAATLAGTLRANWDGYTPTYGSTWQAIWTKDATLSGDFSTYDLPKSGGKDLWTKWIENSNKLYVGWNGGADVGVGKSASTTTPTAGQNVTFKVYVLNQGPEAANGVSVKDALPAGLIFVSAMASKGSYDRSTGIWTVANQLVKDEDATLTLVALVDGSGSITNKADVTAASPDDPDETYNSSSVTLNVVPTVALSLAKTVNTTTPTVGDNVTFTLTVTNDGPDAAATITVKDKLPSGLDFVSADPSNGSYDANTGNWTITNLPKLASATLQLVAKVASTTAVTNEAEITTSTPGGPVPHTKPKVTLTPKPKPGNPEADVYVTKTVDNPTPRPLDSVKFTVTVGNNGPDAATGVVVSDTRLSDGLSYNSDSPSAGTFNSDTGVWTVGGLAVGQTETLVLDMTVSRAGEHVNRATVTSSSPTDPNAGNNQDEEGVVAEQADLSVTKVVDDDTPYNGQTVTFTVTLKNDGPDGSGQVKVKDLLPAGLTFVSATPSEGTYDSSTGMWSVNALRNGFTATLTIVATVAQSGTLTNRAQVWQAAKYDPDSTPGNDVEIEDDQQTVTLTVPVTADLHVANTADKATGDLGDTVTFTVTVTNDGPETATGVTVKDLLPSGLTFVSAVSSAGTYTAGTGLWNVGTLANGATATLTLTATIAGTGTLSNTAQVQSSGALDPDSTVGNSAAGEDDQATVSISVPVGVTGVSPTGGKQGQTLDVTVTGRNFLPNASVSFGAGTTTNSVTVKSTTELSVSLTIASDATLGKRDVTATNTDGGSGTLANGFEVTDGTPPSVVGCTGRGQTGLDIQFSEPVNQGDVLDKANLDIRVPAGSSTPVDLTNAVLTYDAGTNTLKVDGVVLPPGRTYTVTVSNVRDLADNVGSSSACSCTGTVPALWSHTFPAGISLISVPWDCAQVNPAQMFYLPPAQFQMADWQTTRDGESGQYVYFDGTSPKFELGEGRWINLTNPTVGALGDGEGQAAPTDTPFVLPVNKGWFLIGNPWLEDMPWSLPQIHVLQNGVDQGSLAQQLNKPFEQRLVEPYCYPWENGEYLFTFDPAYASYVVPSARDSINDTLMSHAGAFMHFNGENLALSIAPPAAGARASRAARESAPAAGWTVSLQAVGGALKDTALLGVSDALGRTGPASFQAKKPPRASAHWLEIALTDETLAARNQVDTRAPASRLTWRAAVRSSEANREVTLSWPDLSSVPRETNLVLVDEFTGRRQTMRTTSGYRFRTGASGKTRTFRIETMLAGACRLSLTGVAVTTTRGGPTLQYTLSQDAEVVARLVSPAGRTVATMPATRSRGGLNTVALPTRTEAGQPLPRGVYVVELRAAAEDGQSVKAVRSVALR